MTGIAMVAEATKQWCADREHPFVTYNPQLDRSYCRCGQRQEAGEQPMDWEAKRAVFHRCKAGDPCNCYSSGRDEPWDETPAEAARYDRWWGDRDNDDPGEDS